MDNGLLTTSQAANALAISRRTLESWRLKGTGPPFISYSSRCVRYRESDLREWLEKQTSVGSCSKRKGNRR